MKADPEWWCAVKLADNSVVAVAERAKDVLVETRQAFAADDIVRGVVYKKVKDARKDGVTI